MNFREDIPCVGKKGVKPNNFNMLCFSDGFKRERNCPKGAKNLDMILASKKDSLLNREVRAKQEMFTVQKQLHRSDGVTPLPAA